MIYRDIIIEGLPANDDQYSPPNLPDEYMREYLSCIPRIPMPSGRFVFYMRASTEVIERLEADSRVRPAIIAKSWTELFFSEYPGWGWVFDADISETIGGHPCRVRKKLALVSDQEIHGVYVPGVFAGDEVPEFPIPRFVVEKFQRFRSDTQRILPTVNVLNTELLRWLKANPHELHGIRPRQFEELVCEILSRLGWRIELTRASKDGGYDIFGISESAGGVTSSWLIECKKYRPGHKVGVEVVRALCGVKEQVKVANAMIVTTSTFTRDAREMSTKRWDLRLRDHEDVLAWVASSSV